MSTQAARSVSLALLMTLMLAFAGTGTRWVHADDSGMPKLLPFPADRVFAPPGFDSNDNAQVVIQGEFPSTCYRTGPAPQVEVDEVSRRILIRNRAYHYAGSWCHFTLVPFTKVVDLGVLSPGQYQLTMETVSGEPRVFGSLGIAVNSTDDADDQIYAPVIEARISAIGPGRQRVLTLSGSFPDHCFELHEVKVLYRSPNIVEVLPIAVMKLVPTCRETKLSFEKTVSIELPSQWPEGVSLIHVRTMNGQSINLFTEAR